MDTSKSLNTQHHACHHHAFKKAGFEIPYEFIAQLGSRSVRKRNRVNDYCVSRKRLQIRDNNGCVSEVELETYRKRYTQSHLRVVHKVFSCGKVIDKVKHSHFKDQAERFRSTQEAKLCFEQERQNHARLVHPSIVPTIKSEERTQGNDKEFHIWLAYGGKDLITAHRDQQGGLSIHEWMYYLIQSFKGIEHMHRQGYIHRDLKPANIVVNEDEHARLIDLGDTHPLDQSDSLRDMYGTPYYRAPESWNFRAQNEATDVYAAGMCVIQALDKCGLMPPQPKERSERLCPIQWELTEKGKKAGIEHILPVLKQMTAYSPKKRPSISEAIEMLSDEWGPFLIKEMLD